MQFVDKQTHQIQKKNAPKCLINWRWTIRAVQDLWAILQENNFESLNLKYLNQDVLENFFSQIRSNGCANRNPTCHQFEQAFKSLLICNLTSTHSIGANCQETNEGATLALSDLIDVNEEMKKLKDADDIEDTEAAIPACTTNDLYAHEGKIIGIVCKNTLKTRCEECINNLNNSSLSQSIRHAFEVLEKECTNICHETKIVEKLSNILDANCYLSFMSQCTHLRTILLETTASEFIKAWCPFMNNIMCKKIQITQSDNYMYKAAERMSLRYTKKDSEKKFEKDLLS